MSTGPLIRYRPEETAEIIRLRAAGKPWKIIARKIGRNVDRTSLRQHLKRVAPDILVIHRKYAGTRRGGVMSMEGRLSESGAPT